MRTRTGMDCEAGAVLHVSAATDCDRPTRLRLVPCSWADAAAFVDAWHRHHRAPVGYKYAIGAARGPELVGVAIVGRPVARHLDDGVTLEVTRTAVKPGAVNANSLLYGAAWRAAKALGYRRLVTYTQAGESGISLRAAGWESVAQLHPRRGWDTPARRRKATGNEQTARTRWEAPSGGVMYPPDQAKRSL